MEKAGLAVDRAVALARFDLGGCHDFESHLATVAPAGMFELIAVRTNFAPYCAVPAGKLEPSAKACNKPMTSALLRRL